MPIHDVGYRRWQGKLESAWVRWAVIAGAGIRLVWKNHWARRMLFFSWLPAAGLGVVFFVYEQALERSVIPNTMHHPPALTPQPPTPDRPLSGGGVATDDAAAAEPTASGAKVPAWDPDVFLDPNADPLQRLQQLEALKDVAEDARATMREEELMLRAEARRAEREFRRGAVPQLLRGLPHSEAAAEAWLNDPASSRHAVWSLLMMTFFRYPQGTLMVLLVGMIAPSLVSLDFRSRAFLLYFSRPITPFEYIMGKAMVVWCYLAAITTLPALTLYVLGVLLSPEIGVVLETWDLPFRILGASLVLMVPTTALALFFSSMTSESRYAGFAWFAVWGLGWAAYANLEAVSAGKQWSMISLYHMLGRVQAWVFGLSTDINDVTSATALLLAVTVLPFVVLVCRVAAPTQL
ncbi:MAG: hypothetical protein FJ276_23910 [Planctomycetes bacterium]|nr:hypothetical protein [Planctomycetota bacterium]